MGDDVVDQPQEAINEIIPGAGLTVEAALEQRAVLGCEWHVTSPIEVACCLASGPDGTSPRSPPKAPGTLHILARLEGRNSLSF